MFCLLQNLYSRVILAADACASALPILVCGEMRLSSRILESHIYTGCNARQEFNRMQNL